METIMLVSLVLIPAAIYLAWRSKLARVLRALPDNNDDFIHF